ncbi:immunity 22 family protein, partial [Bergeriella denitrificans]|uniref:immunity 22 family protein n=2 Tax=Bergeriella denitrificans TaxID=494 RepID=UPI001C3F9804
ENKMDNEKISIWISEYISYEEQKLLFIPSNDNRVKFLSDFEISTDDFFDYDHTIILYGIFEGKPTNLNKVKGIIKDYPQILDCWDEIENKLKENKIKKINYLLAVPDFEYSSKITRSDKLIFVGNFQYTQDFSSILEFLPEHLKNKLK